MGRLSFISVIVMVIFWYENLLGYNMLVALMCKVMLFSCSRSSCLIRYKLVFWVEFEGVRRNWSLEFPGRRIKVLSSFVKIQDKVQVGDGNEPLKR